MVVEFLYLLLRRKGALQLSLKGCYLLAVAEEHCMREVAVAAGATCFLIVLFQRIGRVQMYYQSDIGLVYTHSEGIGGHHDAYSSLLPIALAEVFLKVWQSCMEECNGVSLHAKHGGNVLCLLSAVGIYYGASRIQVQDMVQAGLVCGGAVQGVM